MDFLVTQSKNSRNLNMKFLPMWHHLIAIMEMLRAMKNFLFYTRFCQLHRVYWPPALLDISVSEGTSLPQGLSWDQMFQFVWDYKRFRSFPWEFQMACSFSSHFSQFLVINTFCQNKSHFFSSMSSQLPIIFVRDVWKHTLTKIVQITSISNWKTMCFRIPQVPFAFEFESERLNGHSATKQSPKLPFIRFG